MASSRKGEKNYILTAIEGKKISYFISIDMSSHSSPFTYTGSIWQTRRGFGKADHFKIQGEGSISRIEGSVSGGEGSTSQDVGGAEIHTSTFEIVEGSGVGRYAGITGRGRLRLEISEDYAEGACGTCVFEGLNEPGTALLEMTESTE